MCCGDSSSVLSRIGVLIGLISLTTLVIAFVSNVWLFTKEPIVLPNSNVPTTISFKIGLWRVCPSIKRINNSQNMPSPACSLIKYSNWEEIRHSDLGIWTHLDFTPAFITRMRLSTPFEGMSIVLMILATFYAVIGHFNSNKKTLVACALYTIAGLCLAGGLLVFASVLSDAFFGHPRQLSSVISKQMTSSYLDMPNHGALPAVDYKYGWSFFAAGAAFILAEIAAVFTITGYLRRYRSVEEMVSLMVPGGRRKLCEMNINYTMSNKKAENIAQIRTKIEEAGALTVPCDAPEVMSLLSKAPPDICTTTISGILSDTERPLKSNFQERSFLEPLVCNTSLMVTEDVERPGGTSLVPKSYENKEQNTPDEIDSEPLLMEADSGTDSTNEFVGTTVPIKVKHSERNYSTLNSRNIRDSNKSTFQNCTRRTHCNENCLPRCDVKDLANPNFVQNRYSTISNVTRYALNQGYTYCQGHARHHQGQASGQTHPSIQGQHGVLHQGKLEVESPSSSGSSISCGYTHPHVAGNSMSTLQRCDCKDHHLRTSNRVIKQAPESCCSNTNMLPIRCEGTLKKISNSALTGGL